ncbi:hypothetical protein SXIM_54700 [Streptomyces xiamenensis]|uniref:Uncharacterized protein n=1 Tax=Streptomyces xiamenensis TaxID=408015 RepID=A0A0F7G178_9ACTN|nr:hypothetical protein SXIM_54700 [Streptomyces xiamenensis]
MFTDTAADVEGPRMVVSWPGEQQVSAVVCRRRHIPAPGPAVRLDRGHALRLERCEGF